MNRAHSKDACRERWPSSAFERLVALGLDRAAPLDVLSYLVHSSGWVRKAARSVWVHGATPAQFFAVQPLVERIMRDRPHTRLVVTSPSHATLQYLRRTFPDEQASPIPWESNSAARQFLRWLHPGIALLLDDGQTCGPVLTRETLSDGIPIVVLLSGPSKPLATHVLTSASTRPDQIAFCVATAADRARLIDGGVASRRVHCVGDLAFDAAHSDRRPPASTVRRLLGIPDHAPLVIATDVPPEEELLVLEAFRATRTARGDARLVFAPRSNGRARRLAAQIHARGWTCLRRRDVLAVEYDRTWDVLLAEAPGETLSFLTAAAAVLPGGSWSAGSDSALERVALAAGCAVVSFASTAEDLGAALTRAVEAPRPRPVPDPTATTNALAALTDLLPDSPALPPVAQAWRVPTLRERAGASTAWRAVAPLLCAARYDDVASLRARLKNPRNILCLGNGPSSEQPSIQHIEHDCLFRVNWRWQTRGVLTSPDIVFVGDPGSIQRLSGCIFGVWTIEMEYGMLLRNLATRGFRRIELATLERISPLIRDRRWRARPTNGALMIVLAAALQPERLVIGGIDLFEHPDGRYPGDVSATNQYSRVHARDTDLALIRLALESYRGELVVLSDILRDALAVGRDEAGV